MHLGGDRVSNKMNYGKKWLHLPTKTQVNCFWQLFINIHINNEDFVANC